MTRLTVLVIVTVVSLSAAALAQLPTRHVANAPPPRNITAAPKQTEAEAPASLNCRAVAEPLLVDAPSAPAPRPVPLLEQAIAVATAPTERSALLVELASAQLAAGHRDAAIAALRRAATDDPQATQPNLALARLTFDRLADTDGQVLYPAINEVRVPLMRAATTSGDDRQIGADVQYYRSRLATVCESGGDWRQAVAFAEQALARSDALRFRRQACLARIRVGDTLDEAAAIRCRAGTSRSDPEELLMEGMFWLRRAQRVPAAQAKDRAVEQAYIAFRDGLAAAGSADPLLKAKLITGRGVAEYCVGLTQVGRETFAGVSAEFRDPVLRYLEWYQITQCR